MIRPVHGSMVVAAFIALIGLMGGSCLALPGQADETTQPSSALGLVYVSDYVSFVGKDADGHVAFALDTNRGRDGEAYQAEHFLVLHDETRGWVDLAGNGAYENQDQKLLDIPDSSAFQFEGTPRTGMTITSPPNGLVLHVEPIPERLARSHEDARFWMGSAPAVLEWDGRRLTGRVAHPLEGGEAVHHRLHPLRAQGAGQLGHRRLRHGDRQGPDRARRTHLSLLWPGGADHVGDP